MAERGKLVKKLDKVFSQWVRSSNADHRGMVRCYTCGIVKHWKEVDAGHFMSRAKYSTRWDEKNVKPQCKHCNMTNGGHQYEFAKHLDREYGKGTADAVQTRSNLMSKWSSFELREMIAYYQDKLKQLK